MKHIALAISSLWGGGAERVVSVWASALAEKGYTVSILVYARVENEYPIDARVTVRPIAESLQACDAMSMFRRLGRFRQILKELKPNAVISFLPEVQVYVGLASVALGIPRIETVRNNPWKLGIVNTKFAPLWHWCFRSCRAVIVQSEDQKPFFSQSVQKKSVVIPNPVDENYITNPKTEYCATAHKIVAAGRLTQQKNYKMMIDAIKSVLPEYTDVSLQIYGAGEQEKELDFYIKTQGLEDSVKLMGRSNELYRVYQNADMYLMSSDYEGMPNALAEAMAIGLPCVSTDCKTGPRDLIDDGENGFLVPCDDAKAMADRVIRIFSLSADEQKIIGQKARNKILTFCSEENSLKRLIALIETM